MTALEVVGAAAIWASFLAIGVFVGLTGFTFVIILLDRWRVTRAVWAFKTTGWISQDNLDHYLDGCAAAWGGGAELNMSGRGVVQMITEPACAQQRIISSETTHIF